MEASEVPFYGNIRVITVMSLLWLDYYLTSDILA